VRCHCRGMIPACEVVLCCPQTVLLCGWGETTFMADLLHELDHGPAALPANSSVTLLNTRPGVDILGDHASSIAAKDICSASLSADVRATVSR